MTSQPSVTEDLPLLNRPSSDASASISDGTFSKLSAHCCQDPESPDNRSGDPIWCIAFVIIIIITMGVGFAVLRGNFNASIGSIDDHGYVCGRKGRALSNYAQSPDVSADLKWSKFVLFGAKNGTSTRTCVDACPASVGWFCISNYTNTNSSSKPCFVKDFVSDSKIGRPKQATIYGFCVPHQSGDDEISSFLHWAVAQLSPRQFGLAINYCHVSAVIATTITIAVIANVALAILFHCANNSTWSVWTVFLIFTYVAVIFTFVAVLIFDVNGSSKSIKNNTAVSGNDTDKTPVAVPSVLTTVDSATIWSLLAIAVVFIMPIATVIWITVLRSKFACQSILQLANQTVISRTTLFSLQIYTAVCSVLLVMFQLVMLMITCFFSAFLDEMFSIGIFSPPNESPSLLRSSLSTVLVIIWIFLWIVMAETIVHTNYFSVSSHIWHRLSNMDSYYFSQKPHSEKICYARSCFAPNQIGTALHASLYLAARLFRLMYFVLVPTSISKLSEAICSVSVYYNGLDFKRSWDIFAKIANERATLEGGDGAETISMFSILSAAGSASETRVDDNKAKWETAEKQLHNLQVNIGDLERKISQLTRLEEQQKDKKREMKVVRDLASAKERSLSSKEAQVRHLLTKLLAEFEKTKRELGEALDRQRVFEIKKMTNPPDAVKLTIEAVAYLLGEKDLDWNSLRVFIVKDSFAPSVLRLDGDTVSIDACKAVRERYFKNKAFSSDRVTYASTTCGILYRWLDALTQFALERDRIKPLLNEIDNLVAELVRLRSQDKDLKSQIAVQNAFIVGGRLQIAMLKKRLERMKAQEDNISLDVTKFEELAKEEELTKANQECTEQHQQELAEQALLNKQIVTYRLLYFIWINSCFCYVVVLSLSLLVFPIARAYMAVFVGDTPMNGLPHFYAIPFAVTFCLAFTIVACVISTFETLIHSCAVAGLIRLQNNTNRDTSNANKLYCSVSVDSANNCLGYSDTFTLPKSIDAFVDAILCIDEEI